MNWLLFTSQKFDKFDKIEKLLIDNNGKCTIINLEDVASDTVDTSLFSILSSSSYAIFNLPNEFVNHKSILFVLGYVIGKGVPVFVSKSILKSEFVLDLVNADNVIEFSDFDNLEKLLNQNLP
ncbi:MAG: hypothetical protein II232_05930, partial [Spirochaetaceae bacterium]|nr:hypothetical protein [Spirochaetaceae bacterium]